MKHKPKRLKVYLILRYWGRECEIVDAYFKKSSAQTKVNRLSRDIKSPVTYHIIKKSIKDSYQVVDTNLHYFGKECFNDLFGN